MSSAVSPNSEKSGYLFHRRRNDLNSKRRRTPCYDGGYTKESGGIPSCRIAIGISVSEFFDLDTKNPTKLDAIISDLKKLDDAQLENIANLVKGLTNK